MTRESEKEDTDAATAVLDDGFRDRDILLNAIMDGGKHAVAVGDKNRVIKIINKAFERMYGYDASYFVGRHLKDLIKEIHLQSELEEEARKLTVEFGRQINYWEVFDVLLESRGFLEHEWTVIRGDKTRISVWLTISIMRDPNGEIYGYLGVAQDITERKAMEREIQQKSILLNAVMDGGKHAIVVSDQNQVIKIFNKASERLYGYEASRFIGHPLRELGRDIHMLSELEDEARKLSAEFGMPVQSNEVLKVALKKRGIHEREWTIVRGDGKKIPVWLTVSTMRDENGNIYGYLCIAQDMTERKTMEQEIQRNGILLNAVMDGGKHGIIMTNKNRDVTVLNHAAERMYGYDADKFLGRNVSVFVDQIYDREELQEEAERLGHESGRNISVDNLFLFAIQKYGTYEREWTAKRSDGTKIPVLLTVTAMRDQNGGFYGSIGIFQDISERREIDRIKNDFISTASHELRTPLTSIRAAVGLVATGMLGGLPEKARDALNVAYRNCERLVRIINDILDVERIESGRMGVDLRAVWVSEMLPQALEANRDYGGKYGVKLVLRNVPQDVQVMADPDRLMQVMANLISNAAKFSPPGSEVWIGAEAHDNFVYFSVRDFGCGIPEDFRPRIFQKFAQSDHSDARHNEGTGLGLSIARKLVEAMNGTIGFETTVDKGTTFFFDLPKAD